MFVLGTGCLSQGERRGKEKSLSIKRVPTDRYVWGCNSQLASPYVYVPVPITTRWLLYQMATYVVSNKRILICDLNVDWFAGKPKFPTNLEVIFPERLVKFYLKHYG